MRHAPAPSSAPNGPMRAAVAFLFLWFFIGGVAHFVATETEMRIVPPWFPWPRAAVLVSGVFELLGAAGLLWRPTRRAAAWGLFVLTLAVTPAHLFMLQQPELFPGVPYWALVLRLPLQLVLLALMAWVATRPEGAPTLGKRASPSLGSAPSSTLVPVHLRDLLLDVAAHPRGQAHLSAASGMVQAGPWLYVVADDEHHLARFAANGEPAAPVHLHRMVSSDLPDGKDQRKKRKPDMEALALLPPQPGQPHGALLALGSGSKPNRQQALVLPLDAEGKLHGAARTLDLAGLYQALAADFPKLNIEGAFVAGDRFCLLQRGNKGDARNACVEYPLLSMLGWLAGQQGEPPPASRILHFALGEVDGVPLGFTDGAALPTGGWIFSAVAEDTSDSYADGRCSGSALGWVSADGKLQRMQTIEGSPKVEGIAWAANGRLLMVTDSDDPAVASQLLALALA